MISATLTFRLLQSAPSPFCTLIGPYYLSLFTAPSFVSFFFSTHSSWPQLQYSISHRQLACPYLFRHFKINSLKSFLLPNRFVFIFAFFLHVKDKHTFFFTSSLTIYYFCHVSSISMFLVVYLANYKLLHEFSVPIKTPLGLYLNGILSLEEKLLESN